MWAFCLRNPEGTTGAAFLARLLSVQEEVDTYGRQHDGEDAEKKNKRIHDDLRGTYHLHPHSHHRQNTVFLHCLRSGIHERNYIEAASRMEAECVSAAASASNWVCVRAESSLSTPSFTPGMTTAA